MGAGSGQTLQVPGVRVHRLRRRRQPRRPRGHDHARAGPVQARVTAYAQVGPEVGLAEAMPRRRVGRCDPVRPLHGQGRLQERVQGWPAGRRRDAGDLLRGRHLGQAQPGQSRQRGQRRQVRRGERPVQGVDADVDRHRLWLGEQLGGGLAGVLLAVRGDRVLQVDHHDVGTGGQRLGDHPGPVPRGVQPGQWGCGHTTPSSRSSFTSAGVRPSSVSTSSVSAPCGRPAQRIAPGSRRAGRGRSAYAVDPARDRRRW